MNLNYDITEADANNLYSQSTHKNLYDHVLNQYIEWYKRNKVKVIGSYEVIT